jgi:hypothetical protein
MGATTAAPRGTSAYTGWSAPSLGEQVDWGSSDGQQESIPVSGASTSLWPPAVTPFAHTRNMTRSTTRAHRSRRGGVGGRAGARSRVRFPSDGQPLGALYAGTTTLLLRAC